MMLGVVLLVGSIGAVLLFSSRPLNQQSGTYLPRKDGSESRLFLVDSQLYYGVYEQSFTLVYSQVSYSVHAGDPCIIINGTVRFDYVRSHYPLGVDVLNVYGVEVGPILVQSTLYPGSIDVFTEKDSLVVFELRIPYNATYIASYELVVLDPPITPVH